MTDDPYAELTSGAALPTHWGINFTRTIHKTPSPRIDPNRVTLPTGYTGLIIGASRGIGEYIAKAYILAKARNILLTARALPDLERVKTDLETIAHSQNHGVNIAILQADASNPSSYNRILQTLQTKYNSRLDCLITNAASADMSSVDRPLHEASFDAFATDTATNYMGPYYAMMSLMPLLLQSEGKTIINVVSGGVHLVELPPASYNVSKLANLRMGEVAASVYAGQGVNCFGLHPGNVLTPSTRKLATSSWSLFTDDITLAPAFCVWLSNERPSWLSGRYLAATWDVDELQAMKEEIVKGDKLKFRMVV